MFKDQDEDGYGSLDHETCLCQYGDSTSTVNPNDGFVYVIFGGDCNDHHNRLKPLSCADNYDNDSDGTIDGDDPDCISGYTESGDELEARAEYLDGHDNDCDGRVPAVEMDCDDDGSLPVLPLEADAIDTTAYPQYAGYGDYREAWSEEGFQTAPQLGLSECEPDSTMEIPDCLGESTLTLECDEYVLRSDDKGNQQIVGSGLWMVRYADSSDGFGARYDGGYRSYDAISGGRLTQAGGDCDDHCTLRYPDAIEVCDGVDNNCSEVSPGSDDDGVPDSLDAAVTLAGSIPLAESDQDSDGALDCDAFNAADDGEAFTESGCDSTEDSEWLVDGDDTDPDVYGPGSEPVNDGSDNDHSADTRDTGKKTCSAAPGAGGLAMVLAMLAGLRRRR